MTLVLTFLYALASALIPLVNAEVYVAAVAEGDSLTRAVTVGVVAGLGQTVGKLIWYLAALKFQQSKPVQKRLDNDKARALLERWSERSRERPVLFWLVTAGSAVGGIPPLLIVTLVAGAIGAPLRSFLSACAIGRIVRFAAIAYGASFLLHW